MKGLAAELDACGRAALAGRSAYSYGAQGRKDAGRRVQLFGRVYEWSWDESNLRWSLGAVWTNKELELVAELQRALNAGELGEMAAAVRELNALGNYEFGDMQ